MKQYIVDAFTNKLSLIFTSVKMTSSLVLGISLL